MVCSDGNVHPYSIDLEEAYDGVPIDGGYVAGEFRKGGSMFLSGVFGVVGI